jgi:hypothetical protein
MQISFADDAYETFQILLQRMQGFGVTVTTLDGNEISGVLVGPDLQHEWGDAVLIHPVAEGDDHLVLAAYTDTPQCVRAKDVHVH